MVQILADSLHPNGVDRFTTFLIQFPKCLLAELNTHRQLCRSVGSSRAIPLSKMIEKATTNTFFPKFTKNQKGMQGLNTLTEKEILKATETWQEALENTVRSMTTLNILGIHKQNANRLLEPFLYVDVLLSGTEWTNFFRLRTAPDAQPEFQAIAIKMKELFQTNIPKQLNYGEWHLPFPDKVEGLDLITKLQVVTARAARLSYESYDGTFSIENDLALFDKLVSSKHESPLEHSAKVVDNVSDTYLYLPNYDMTLKQFIDVKLHKYLFLDKDSEEDKVFKWSRNYAGFYTYRHHLEDQVKV